VLREMRVVSVTKLNFTSQVTLLNLLSFLIVLFLPIGVEGFLPVNLLDNW
jgi:hypothetical protein